MGLGHENKEHQPVSCSDVFVEFISVRSSEARLPGFKSQLHHVLDDDDPLRPFPIIKWR